MQRALEAKVAPTDDFLQRVYSVMLGETKDEIITYVLEVYSDHYQRDNVFAFFLCDAHLEQIEWSLRLPLDVLAIFEQLFIDRKAFRNKMEWRLYAENYAEHCCLNDETSRIVKIGIMDGPIPLQDYWALGNEVVEVPQHMLIQKVISTAFLKASAGRRAPIASIAAREAHKWGVTAVRILAESANIKDKSGMETDAIVAIQKRKATLTAEEADLDLGEILH